MLYNTVSPNLQLFAQYDQILYTKPTCKLQLGFEKCIVLPLSDIQNTIAHFFLTGVIKKLRNNDWHVCLLL